MADDFEAHLDDFAALPRSAKAAGKIVKWCRASHVPAEEREQLLRDLLAIVREAMENSVEAGIPMRLEFVGFLASQNLISVMHEYQFAEMARRQAADGRA